MIDVYVYQHTFLSAGKSTLLQILAGKRLVTSSAAQVLMKGCDVFRNSPPGVTYLGTEWEVLSEEIACGHISI
jgi:ABC-type cobalamin/Fe3+-siderophores transport system ATPase subunit